MPEKGAQLNFYSFGIVANNKPLSETKIMVTPIEKLSMLDGEIASLPVDEEVEGEDGEGQAYTSKVTTDTALEAEWLPFGANRRTANDMRRGMRVMIWQIGDADDYRWTYLGLDDHLLKLETAVYTWSATTDEDADSTDPENCYSLEVSTHSGHITLRTAKQHKEYCEYAFQFDLNNGIVQLVDDLDNEFVFDSKNTLLRMKNADGSFLELDKEIIRGHAPDSILLDATKLIHLTTEKFVLDATTVEVNSQTNTFNTPQSSFNGNVTVTGSFSMGTQGGNATFQGPATFKSAVTFEAPIQANGITSSAPIRGPSDTI